MKLDGAGRITASWQPAIAANLNMVLVAMDHFKTSFPPGRRDPDPGLETSLGSLVSAVRLARVVASFILWVEAEAMVDAHDLPVG